MLDFRELTYVVAIVDAGGFSNAARKLFISQPSLSQYVKKLEDSLGFAIFERRGNSTRLTYAGKEYVTFARETLRHRDQFLLTMNEMSSIQKGHLRIGVSFFRSSFYIPQLIPAFKEKYPSITIELLEQPAPTLEKAVAHGEIDLAISNLPVYVSGITYERLIDEMILLSIPTGHPLCGSLVQKTGAKYPNLDLRLAFAEPFIMMTPLYRLRTIANHICLDAGFIPSVILETSNFGTALRLVAKGFGLTFTPESLFLDNLGNSSGVCATFTHRDYTWPIAILRAEKGYLSDAAKTFIEFSHTVLCPKQEMMLPSSHFPESGLCYKDTL